MQILGPCVQQRPTSQLSHTLQLFALVEDGVAVWPPYTLQGRLHLLHQGQILGYPPCFNLDVSELEIRQFTRSV